MLPKSPSSLILARQGRRTRTPAAQMPFCCGFATWNVLRSGFVTRGFEFEHLRNSLHSFEEVPEHTALTKGAASIQVGCFTKSVVRVRGHGRPLSYQREVFSRS